MHLTDLQVNVAQFVDQHNLHASPAYRLLDLTSELGEVSKALLQASEYGKGKFEPGQTWEEEIGDLFFSLLCLANNTDVDLEAVLAAALQRYAQRIQQRGDPSSGT